MTQRTIVLHPVLKNRTAPRDAEFALEEAVGLARAIDLEIVESRLVTVRDPRPSTLLGEGKITELGDFIGELEIGLAVVDTQLSLVQQRNLEQAWKCKVIDRTALILEIFGERAHLS